MKVLVTNDDGVKAAGIQELVSHLPGWVEAVIAAPAQEKSAAGHSISLKDKLVVEIYSYLDKPCYAVHGTPADSVKFALSQIADFKPDVVISGINQGTNTGVSVYYSGTISAAREAFINGIPSIAVSLASKTSRDFDACCRITNQLLEAYSMRHFPLDTMLSVNVPPLPWDEMKGVRVTKQAHSRFVEEFVHEGGTDEKKVFSLAGQIELWHADGTSDEEAVAEGYISITPLKLDLTHYHVMPSLEKWAQRTFKPI